MARLTAEDQFNIELLKLMLQVAWSDGQVATREAGVILGAARSWGVPEAEVTALRRAMQSQNAPPAPDLAVLRERADEALEAMRAVIVSDGRLERSEKEMLEELRVILTSAS